MARSSRGNGHQQGRLAGSYSEAELKDKYDSLTARLWQKTQAETVHEVTMALQNQVDTTGLLSAIHDANATIEEDRSA